VKPCTRPVAGHLCGETTDTHLFTCGQRCPIHTPAALLGIPEPGWGGYTVKTPQQLREEGTTAVIEASDDTDKAVVRRAILETARLGKPFSPNDVRPLLPKLRSNNLIGAMFLSMLATGEISKIDETPSTDGGTHYKRIGVYVLGSIAEAAA
jgi:hypothetical protein